MKLFEEARRKKKIMTPFRWKILTVGIPLYLLVLFFPAPIILGLLAVGNDAGLIVAYAWVAWFVVVDVAAFVLLAQATKVDVKNEIARYHYLFEREKAWSGEPIAVPDENCIYTLTDEGAKLELPEIEGEQIFDEARENIFYIPWERAELALATQSVYRHVYLALAVFPLDINDDSVPFFIPMTEEVFAFLKKKNFGERMGGEWEYLFYNPEDAFKQLVLKGRILTMRNKRTGKLFVDKNGEFIGDR